MITVLFFASLKEALETEKLTVSFDHAITVAELLSHLQEKSLLWKKLLSSAQLMIAVNQQMSQADTMLKSGDEVAFFPPVTGG
jgi:molybdopterin synthase sulfur carrier subunit